MASPNREPENYELDSSIRRESDEEGTMTGSRELPKASAGMDTQVLRERLQWESNQHHEHDRRFDARPSASQVREEANRINDDLAMMKIEKVVSQQMQEEGGDTILSRSRSRKPEPIDDFDANTNPIHERTQVYKPPENPSTKLSQFFKYVHGSWWFVRYFVYIAPVFLLLLIPVLMGALLPVAEAASVGGVKLLWFGVWLEIIWLTLWAGRLLAKSIPYPMGLVSSMFTNNSKKWRDLGKALQIPATLFFWWLAVLISFLPTMKNHHVDGNKDTKDWERTLNKIIVAVFVGITCNFVEKIIIQLIAISFHLRTYSDRIDINKFQIGSLTKLYIFSKAKIAMEDAEFEEKMPPSGTRTPAIVADHAQAAITKAFAKVGDVAGTVAGDFAGRKVVKSGHPSQVVLQLLNSTTGSQVLARRLYRTFVREGFETVFSGDLKPAFDNEEEADAAFSMFDKDMNGDISMEELESVCVEIGRERKAITASLKDLDSVVSKLDDVLFFIVLVIFVLVLISLISTSAAGVLTSAGSAVLALSWLFAATAQEFLQSVIFVFVKHPFDVGDRVSIYGNTGSTLKGDDYFVKEISLLYTEFKKMEGHVVQAPNSYLNTLFILNQRRSGGLAEAVPIIIRFGTTIDQIEALRQQLTEFVLSEKREYQGKILTELREVTEAYSLTLNVVFFYKSNWQNELLRLQRRNKFICAMMTAMQELNIEGPRRNNAGWRNDLPMYFNGSQGPPPLYSSNGNADQPPPPPEQQEQQQQDPPQVESQQEIEQPPVHPSILRHRAPSTARNNRTRGESVTSVSRHVDFSLGMKDISSADFLGDISEEDYRSPSRYREIIREVNEAADEEKARQRRESAASATAARSAERDRPRASHEMSPNMSGGLFRRGTGLSTRQRGESVSSQATHRNRFLNRLGHPSRSIDLQRDSLAEEGHAGPATLDPRSGQVTSQAVRLESGSSLQRDTTSLSLERFPSAVQDMQLKQMGSKT